MEAHPRFKSAELLPSNLIFQDGDTRDHPTLPSKRGVGDISGFQRRLLPYTNRTKVAEIPQILSPQSSLSVHRSPLWPLNGSVGVHKGGQRSQINGTGSGYQDPPVPRRLVAESPLPGNVPTSYPDPLGPVPQVRVGSQFNQVGVGTSADIQLRRLPFRPLSGAGQTDPGEVDGSVPKDQRPPQSTGVFGQTVHVPYRATNSHRETGSSRSAPHAPYPVASEEALACAGIIRENHSSSSVPSSTPEVVVGPRQCPKRSTSTPIATRSSTYINKEGGMKSGSLCALLWRLLMWCNQRQIVLRARHIPGHLNVIADKLSRHGQVIQTEWSLLQEVFDRICRRWHKPEVDLFATKFNHKLPRFVSLEPGKWML